jgi:hypothetical protein
MLSSSTAKVKRRTPGSRAGPVNRLQLRNWSRRSHPTSVAHPRVANRTDARPTCVNIAKPACRSVFLAKKAPCQILSRLSKNLPEAVDSCCKAFLNEPMISFATVSRKSPSPFIQLSRAIDRSRLECQASGRLPRGLAISSGRDREASQSPAGHRRLCHPSPRSLATSLVPVPLRRSVRFDNRRGGLS